MADSLMNYSYELNNLVQIVPVQNSYRSISELNKVLDKYVKILNHINGYNASYKSATRIYYADITNIRDNIQQLLFADSQQEKDTAFENAKNELKAGLRALATLIKPEEELVA